MRRKNILIMTLAIIAVLGISLVMMQSTFDVRQHAILETDDNRTLPAGMIALSNAPFPDIPDHLQTTPPFDISAYDGRIVLINFWASWCAPCRVEFPDLLELADAHKENATMIFISNDRDPDDITRFFESLPKSAQDILENSENIVLLNDPTQSFTREVFQTYKLPETYTVSKDGTLKYKIIGAATEAHMQVVEEALQSDPPHSRPQ